MHWHDVHAHLTDPRLAADEAGILDRARAAGVRHILSNGLNPTDNARVAALAQRAPDLVRPCFGLYPVDAVLPQMLEMGIDYPRDPGPLPSADEAIDWVAAHVHQAFAVGEIGLDHYWVPEALWDAQEAAFRRLVRLAMDADKAIIIHTRKAEARTFEVLKELGATRVNWHCFGGKVKLAQRIAAHGHWLSMPANARKHGGFSKMIQVLPRERLLLETDCPYLGPVRDELNEPANVTGTAALMAETWGCDLAEVSGQLEANFGALFEV